MKTKGEKSAVIIEKKISWIGQQLVNDSVFYAKYPDLVCKPEKGIVPHCLSYETEQRELTKRGSVIVGLNPGSMVGRRFSKERKEIKLCRKKGVFNYRAVDDFSKRRFMFDGDDRKAHAYYRRLRDFINQLDLRGPILWTEIVKCESKIRGRLSVKTIRDDINRYLFREVKLTPKDWPLIGVGDEAYRILSYYFHDRLVIGVPHVTGVRNDKYSLNQLFQGRRNHKNIKKEIKKKVLEAIHENSTDTLRLIDLIHR